MKTAKGYLRLNKYGKQGQRFTNRGTIYFSFVSPFKKRPSFFISKINIFVPLFYLTN